MDNLISRGVRRHYRTSDCFCSVPEDPVLGFGPANQTVILEQLLDSKSLFLTAITTTPYTIVGWDSNEWPISTRDSIYGPWTYRRCIVQMGY